MGVKYRRKFSDYVIDFIIYTFMLIMIVSIVYPLLNALAISLNNATDTARGGITIYPRVPTLRNYELIFDDSQVYKAYFITVSRTLIGTVGGLFLTSLLAFGMAHPNLVGRKFYVMFFLVPMYFSGGLIPFYFLIKNMGMTDNYWVYIIPRLVNLWNMILMRSYFQSIPMSLEESARIDGANYLITFFRIIFPVSVPIFATIALYFGVMHWNEWYDAFLFINKRNDLKPMQSVLISIINNASYAERIAGISGSPVAGMENIARGRNVNVRSVTMATMIVTIIPIVCTYPFLQKYFIKGIMIGSIKG